MLYSITGKIADNGGKPKFDSSTNKPTKLVAVTDTDFGIDIEFDSKSFAVPLAGSFLELPWESVEENEAMELRARLTVETKIESDVADNDTLDLPMVHKSVPNDGTDPKDTSDCVGIGTVYPKKMLTGAFGKRVEFAGETVRVFLDEELGKRTESIKSGSYSISILTKSLATIFTDAGFGVPVVTEFKRTDPKALAIWTTLSTGEVVAKGVTSSTSISDADGVDIPFFEYWLWVDEFVAPPPHEVAHSEITNEIKADAKKKTKRAITPIGIHTKSGSPFERCVKKTVVADVPHILATAIAHEIGHSLGLRHGLEFDSVALTYTIATRIGTMTSPFTDAGARAIPQLFGPVHKDVLKKKYL
ncbi:MAG: hypothetical protein NVS3B20_09130 [Polyangiales bacterium]